MAHGFSCIRKARWLKETESRPDQRVESPRWEYRRQGCVYRVLMPNQECEWWTVQKWHSETSHWYVDFPLDVPVDDILRFMRLE